MPRSAPRVALYSHDTLGLGHVRRNLLLAQRLADSPLRPVTLSIVGKPEACRFPLPARGDRLVLPALRKGSDGAYEPASLGVPLADVVELRAAVLRAALESFRPDLVIVDKEPRGALRELDDALTVLRSGSDARVVLGLRDVLDSPEVVHRQWRESDSFAALRQYDEIWVYGDRRILDAPRDYRFPAEVVPKIRFTGYFDLRERLRYAAPQELEWVARLGIDERDTVLCLLGGGQDGGALATAFAATTLPGGWRAVVVTGPYLPDETVALLERRAAADPAFRVFEFVREPLALVERCRCVVAMGGYNTVWEVVSMEKPLLVVPRVAPRLEQAIRARRLAELGVLDVLMPDQLRPAALSDWIAAQSRRPQVSIRDLVPLDGLVTVVERATALLGREALVAAT